MAIRGQRFNVDLSSEDEADVAEPPKPAFSAGTAFSLVGDIKERSFPSTAKSPSLLGNKSAETGFPAHKIRVRQSTFKRGRASQPPPTKNSANVIEPSPHALGSTPSKNDNAVTAEMGGGEWAKADETRGIDEENKQRIAKMSPDEIEEARNELLTGLSPSLIERLLQKANIEEGCTPGVNLEPARSHDRALKAEKPSKKVAFDIPDLPPIRKNTSTVTNSQSQDPDLAPSIPPPDLQPASSPLPPPNPQPTNTTPPPPPPPPPTLDPSSPSFLSDLHETYFPSLPSNPSAMAWMAPASPSEESSYSATLPSLPPSALRFDFRAHLLPPRLAAQIPVSKGLHHHSSAPDAAGYTVPELAHLARSAVPSQRCIAYQSLGRVLYRLGRGDFGREGEDLNEGLWRLMEDGKVLDVLIAEAGRGEGGNRSCWVTATEAVWLWRKGGGRRWKAG